ncbi:MAG TPA: PIG-L family deacetylase [Armatimonadota bacterium]|jgi:LmbE family N-acetylglucosaminyl deacetylase
MTIRNPLRARNRRPVSRHRRRLTRVTGFAAAIALVVLLATAWRIRTANIDQAATDLHLWPAPGAADRLLVFAPHCDDETLGLAAYIQQALHAGAQVRVVFMTNGDGFTWSAEREFKRVRVGQAGYVQFGMARQQEALTALAISGVPSQDVTFLGYPDGGLAELWLHNWTPATPYVSRFTGFSRSPYPNSLTRGAIYCGQNVRADVQRLVREFRPTQVFCPHSADNHPDHWATFNFVTDVLWTERRAGGTAAKAVPVQGLYLIHRGDWPVPQGYHPDDGLPPPAGLAHLDTDWRQVPVNLEQRDTKRRAIAAYVSQMRVMKRFLTSFVRRNELIGTRPSGPLTIVPEGAIRVDGDSRDWDGIPISVQDPPEDSIQSDFGASGDILTVQAAEDSRRLFVRIVTRKPISKNVAYDVYWHALPDVDGGTHGVSLRQGVAPVSTVRAVAKGPVWEISMPRPAGGAVFVGVHCRYHRFLLDKSGWRVLEPSGTFGPAE